MRFAMQKLTGTLIDEDSKGNPLAEPYYILEDGSRVFDRDVFKADPADLAEKAAALGWAISSGEGDALELLLWPDELCFCNSSKLH
jgi:hypothetical protein